MAKTPIPELVATIETVRLLSTLVKRQQAAIDGLIARLDRLERQVEQTAKRKP